MLLNSVRMSTATVGTGTITLGSAISSHLTMAEAGASNLGVYPYRLDDGADFEIGLGTYTVSGTTFSRDSVTVSKIAGVAGTTKLTLSGSAQFSVVLRAAEVREVLTAARTYYVRTDGSNSNNGLADTAGGAFLTIQKAVDVVSGTLDLAGFTATIQVRTGTYTGAVTLKPCVGAAGTAGVILTGDTTTPANVVISTTSNNAIQVTAAKHWAIQGFKIQTTTFGNGISASYTSQVLISSLMDFGAVAFGGAHLVVTDSAEIVVGSNYNITAGATYHWLSLDNGQITATGRTLTITGTPAFSQFAFARNGRITATSNTYTGSATGSRFFVGRGGSIYTESGSLTTFPGDAAGTFDGGWYDGILGALAGTATVPPVYLKAGTLQTTPDDGAVEMDANCLYGCTDAGNRGVIPVKNFTLAAAAYNMTNTASEQAAFTAAQDTLTLETGTYRFNALNAMTAMSATSGNAAFDLLGAGSAVLGTVLYHVVGQDVVSGSAGAAQGGSWAIQGQTAASAVTAATGTAVMQRITGTFEISTAGTLIPSITLVTAAAAIQSAGSYFECWRVGALDVTLVGQVA